MTNQTELGATKADIDKMFGGNDQLNRLFERRQTLKKMQAMLSQIIENQQGHASQTMLDTYRKIEVELLFLKLELNCMY